MLPLTFSCTASSESCTFFATAAALPAEPLEATSSAGSCVARSAAAASCSILVMTDSDSFVAASLGA